MNIPSEIVYADNAATTRVSESVLNAMIKHYQGEYGNPSSLYDLGQRAKKAINAAREPIAKLINADPAEIFFTGSGTEADNMALKGVVKSVSARNKGKNHIITTKIEHPAILRTAEHLERDGFEVTYLDVDRDGLISLEQLENAITEKTALISVMSANNEIGTVQPIAEIGAVCREAKVTFHTDAVQAVGHIPVNVAEQNIDMLSLSAHKCHGPKGIGALYCRRGVRLLPFIDGGAQERGKRAGTENIAEIAAMAAALKEACANMEQNSAKLVKLRDRIISELTQIPHSRLNGDMAHHLPGTINMCFEGIEGEGLLLHLDDRGICASSGSACTSGSLDPSHVLLAIGLPHEVAHGSLRLSLSEYNTEEDADRIIKAVPEVVEYLRNMSPVWKEMVRGEKPFLL